MRFNMKAKCLKKLMIKPEVIANTLQSNNVCLDNRLIIFALLTKQCLKYQKQRICTSRRHHFGITLVPPRVSAIYDVTMSVALWHCRPKT